MANDLTIRHDKALALISSPELLKLRRISIGTVEWPGSPTRRYLAGGSKLTDEERAGAGRFIEHLKTLVQSPDGPEPRAERLAIITKMLFAKPIANASKEVGRARAESYLEALDDVPPWAIAEAVRRWHRGECGDHNYEWAPGTATLRRLALELLEPHKRAAVDLENLLAATSIEEAMLIGPPDGEEARARVSTGFAKLKTKLAERPCPPRAPPPVPTDDELRAHYATPAGETAEQQPAQAAE